MNCVSFLTLATETLFIHAFLPWTKSRCFNHSFRFSTPWGAKNKNRQFHGKKLKKSINTKAVCLLATEKKNALGIKMGLIYSVLPISGTLIIAYALVNIVTLWRHNDEEAA